MKFTKNIVALSLLPLIGCRALPSSTHQLNEAYKGEDIKRNLWESEITTDCPESSICLTFLQINDTYEIDAVNGGTKGGFDRIAGLKQLLLENPNAGPVVSVLAGDFFNPSGLGVIKEGGKSWNGRQMISTLKAAGLDLAIFGNHEFDLQWEDFKSRLDESKSPFDSTLDSCLEQEAIQGAAPRQCLPDLISFGSKKNVPCFDYIASNVFATQASGSTETLTEPLFAGGSPIPRTRILTIKRGSKEVAIGLLALTINKNKKDYMRFSPVTEAAKELTASELKQANHIIALTHIDRADDIKLLNEVPEIALSMGGHDHIASYDCVGDKQQRCIAKADANARSAYVHRLIVNEANQLTIKSKLIQVDDSIPKDERVKKLIGCWYDKADKIFQQNNPSASGGLKAPIAYIPDDPLDGVNQKVRNRNGTNLTDFFTHAMLSATKSGELESTSTQFALLNAGAIRVDDIVGPGTVTKYDAIRVLPFGGELTTARIRITDFAKILFRSWTSVAPGSGAIFHIFPKISQSSAPLSDVNLQTIESQLVTAAKASSSDDVIEIVTIAYLIGPGEDLTNEEKSYFKSTNSPLTTRSVRDAFIQSLEKKYPIK